jgi:hypothetical protein
MSFKVQTSIGCYRPMHVDTYIRMYYKAFYIPPFPKPLSFAHPSFNPSAFAKAIDKSYASVLLAPPSTCHVTSSSVFPYTAFRLSHLASLLTGMIIINFNSDKHFDLITTGWR